MIHPRAQAYRRAAVLALLLVAAVQLGVSSCVGVPTSGGEPAQILVVPGTPMPVGGSAYVVTAKLQVDAQESFQAIDLDFSWSAPSPERSVSVFQTAEFDDQFGFLQPPTIDPVAGRITGMVDVRHGPAAGVSGTVTIATITAFVGDGGDIIFEGSGDVAGPDGVLFATASSGPVVVSAP